MKMFKYLALSMAAMFCFASCVETDISERDVTTRVTLSPLTQQFEADGATYTAAVQIAQGSVLSDLAWEAAVTSSTPWVTLSKTTVKQSYTGTYDTETVYDSYVEGIEVKISKNTEYKRSFEITVTVADGATAAFSFTQLGAKADAAVSTGVKALEFLAPGGTEVVEYTSNMGNVVAFTFTAGDGSAVDWLTAKALGEGKVEVTAAQWTNKESNRTATMTITVGSADTSLAKVTIPVTQLAAVDHSFIYGASVADTPIDKALQMEKIEEGIFTIKTFFNEDASNQILINKFSRVLSYPCYALAADGKVAVLESATTAYTAPTIVDNGIRDLTVNFNTLTWEWAEVSTQYAMPDSELGNYPTKSYIARDGSMKTWMIRHMAWDGGDIHPKLGSGMVKHTGNGTGGTGGYAAADFPRTWNDTERMNPAFETKESGLGNLETYSDDGRIYTYHEMLGYEARFGIGYARYENGPWVIGEKYTDARGTTYTFEVVSKTAADYTGDNAVDEEKYPIFKVQAQGICPYGWHIANASDWLDLFYAMSQATISMGETKYPVKAEDCTYKMFITGGGIPNSNGWLRYTKDWGTEYSADNADAFGFNYYPIGYRYMTQGFQNWSMRVMSFVPLPMAGANSSAPNSSGGRYNVINKTNAAHCANLANIDIGQAVFPFRCVKNYK